MSDATTSDAPEVAFAIEHLYRDDNTHILKPADARTPRSLAYPC